MVIKVNLINTEQILIFHSCLFNVGFMQISQRIVYYIGDLTEAIFLQDINTIVEALPALEVLNLTNNLMEHDLTELPSLKRIRILVLNNCSITWKEVISNQILTLLPSTIFGQVTNCCNLIFNSLKGLSSGFLQLKSYI